MMPRPAPKFKVPASVDVGSAPDKGETAARRATITADALVTQPFEGINTALDVVNYAARTYGDRQAYGTRPVQKIIEEEKMVKKKVGGKEVEEKKIWKYFQLGDYEYVSYADVKVMSGEVSRGLLELGIKKEDVVNVYSQTSMNWQLIAHGCAAISTPIATAYDSLGESGLQHSLDEPHCVAIFTNTELLGTLSRVLPKTPSVRLVIYDGKPDDKLLETLRGTRDGVVVLSIDELRAKGRESKLDTTDRAPKAEDVMCIMYTSGSTGAPKGVVITHSNLISSVGGVYTLLGHHFKEDDCFLAYLPLAHILEYIVELTLFFVGMKIGYGRVKTLTDASVRNCLGDIRAFRPTIMVGVPQVWESIKKGIEGKVQKSGTIKKAMFEGALKVKKANVPILTSVVDSVVFSAVRHQTGGRLRLTLSGGAALSKETQEFLTNALVTVLQGYGMTESCGMCTILPPELFQYTAVGVPVPSIEIKLLDVPEAGYHATDKPCPRGEVCIRGGSVIKEYYKRPDLNSDPTIFMEGGWLRTGDVGQWNADGTLSIIDRIKNLVKLNGGEYVAIESLESSYKSCTLVHNICIYADSSFKQPVAIVHPHESNLHGYFASNPSLAGKSIHELVHSDEVRGAILKELVATGKKAGFSGIQIVGDVVLTDEEWTPENGFVTAAQKIQRKKIKEAFSKEIESSSAKA